MPSKNIVSKSSWQKNWLRDWAAIDLTVLPIGILLAYFLNSNFANGFWFNLSTELIGAYISVRFIDYLLKKSESRHARRREIARDINLFADQANQLVPSFDENLLVVMRIENQGFEERWRVKDERKKLLYEDEILEVENLRESRKKVIKLANRYVENYKTLRQVDIDINNLRRPLPAWWKDLQEQVNYYRTTKIASKAGVTRSLQEALNELALQVALSELGDTTSRVEGISLFEDYAKILQLLIDDRGEIEKEIQNHLEMNLNLQHNIYQESG